MTKGNTHPLLNSSKSRRFWGLSLNCHTQMDLRYPPLLLNWKIYFSADEGVSISTWIPMPLRSVFEFNSPSDTYTNPTSFLCMTILSWLHIIIPLQDTKVSIDLIRQRGGHIGRKRLAITRLVLPLLTRFSGTRPEDRLAYHTLGCYILFLHESRPDQPLSSPYWQLFEWSSYDNKRL